jgi:DNA-binding SARP family transcriptional activator/DNA-binding beta-propeller fold protein YncE
MDFRILGPLEVSDDGRAVEVPPGQRRAVLIDLLLHANEVVSDDKLIDDLWGEHPPPTAQKILQLHISNLRKALGAERIATRLPGYVLQVRPGELDADRVREVADRAASPAELRAGLAEWRGRALIDVEFKAFARPEVERLEELRLTLLERLFAAELERGRHAEAIGELEALVAEHPLRERPRALLMLALYRSGRHAEALDRYRAGRAQLVGELGLEPSRELQRLEQQILEQDPELTAPAPMQAVTRRRRGLAAAGAALGAAALAAGLVVLLTGGTAAARPAANSVVRVAWDGGRYTSAVHVGAAPRAIAATKDALFVANFGDSTVTCVDLRRHRASAVGLAAPPTALAVNGGAAWVASSFSSTLVRLDSATGAFDSSVVLRQPVDALAAGAGAVWAVNEEAGTLTRIEPVTLHTSVYRLRLHGPSGVVVAHGHVWIAESFTRRLLRLDPVSGRVAAFKLTLTPDVLGEGCGSLWLTNPSDNEVTQIDESSMRERLIAVGENPIAVAAARSTAWVANDISHTVDEIDCQRGAVLRALVLGANAPGQPKLTPSAVTTAPEGSAWVTVNAFGRA